MYERKIVTYADTTLNVNLPEGKSIEEFKILKFALINCKIFQVTTRLQFLKTNSFNPLLYRGSVRRVHNACKDVIRI